MQTNKQTDFANQGDTISRIAALDALNGIASDLHARKRLDEEYIASWCAETIEQLPSAQLAQDLTKGCTDTIDRQDAIDAVRKNTFRLTFAEEQNCEGRVAWSAEAVYSDVMEGALLELPSAQPEPLTDKEQRIFLSAMEREEIVCKQYDDKHRNCREPYEDSLVSVCRNIVRKVKGALWMI